ncbi:LGALS3 [Branchiostoma lanceolatum]|uniref:LGALS3 protein n=1 Tax=Branchiostoma lanceolatum TaxID=7740 RepID=A0A8K0A2E3_BRALA|nr:LGALS3 [Branchiostoma lanceolatum]
MCCGAGGCCEYKGTCIRNLGWTLIVLGVVGVILAVIADGVYAGYPFATLHHVSTPIWGGVFIIIPGGLAVCGGKNPDNACRRIALLVMSIFGIMFAMIIWIMASLGLAIDGNECDRFKLGPCDKNDHYDYGCSWWDDYWYRLYPNWRDIDCGGIKALHALQLVLGLTETVVMFIVSIRACCGTCRNCCDSTQQPPTHAFIYQPGQPLQQQMHSGGFIMQTVPGAPPGQPYAGQQLVYNPQAQPGAYPGQPQPGVYPAQPQPGVYPAQPQPGAYPAQPQPGAYPGSQPSPYPTQAGSYPTQAGSYPAQMAPPSTESQPPPYDVVTDQKI